MRPLLQSISKRPALLSLALLFLLSAIFYVYPEIDLWTARELYLGNGKFLFSDSWISWFFLKPADQILKFGFIIGLIGYIGILTFRVNISASLHQKLQFVFISCFVSVVLIINLILKGFWGRARPSQITEFGGTATFTPAWEMAQECAKNCSFVSGHAGMAACVGLLVVFIPRRYRALYLAAAAIFTIAAAFMRMARGAHFLSDVTLAPLMVLTTALCLRFLLKR